MKSVNQGRELRPAQTPQHPLDDLHRPGGKLGRLCTSVLPVVNRPRILSHNGRGRRLSERELQQQRNYSMSSRLDKNELPWTMATAFYALSGGSVMRTRNGVKTFDIDGLELVLHYNPAILLPVQRAAIKDPSKANGLAKFITCIQAFWFCSQCIARLIQDMAISLLELNTFAHCISACFIYVFWWHKPYDVTTHAYIDISELPQHIKAALEPRQRMMSAFGRFHDRSRNMAEDMFSPRAWLHSGLWRPLIMVFTFFIYGAVHLLAWQYHFPTSVERDAWRCASIATASSGLIVLLTVVRALIENEDVHGTSFFHSVLRLFGLVVITARSFLVIESFRALPNSPASIYEVPRWTAYVLHF
jgi:hypothetical protein